MQTKEDERSKKLLIAVIVALLLITSIFLYFFLSVKTEQLASLDERKTLDSTFRSLTDTLNVRNAEIDTYISRGVHLDTEVV